ncbi:MAG: hypothetical protein R3E33_03035 [Rhodocyclaceae bacterium]
MAPSKSAPPASTPSAPSTSPTSRQLNPGMVGDDILLGMSALRHPGIYAEGDKLTLRVAGEGGQ